MIFSSGSGTTPQMNGFIERVFSIIKELLLAIMLNDKINDTDQKMLWAESVRTCTRVRNSMANTGSTTSPFKKYGQKQNIIDPLSEFGRIGYVTKQYKN